jgi:lipopolysaccharide transport system permease protein
MTMAHLTSGSLPERVVSTFASPVVHGRLLRRLARRDLEARYRGSMLGTLWLVINPLIMLAVYTVVFLYIFPSRWAGATDTRSFVLLLFAGLVVFQSFAEPVQRAAGLFLENPSYVKKVVFPLEVLPWTAVAIALVNALGSFAILIVFHLVLVGPPPATAVLVPLLLLPLGLISVGLTFMLASLGVFVRDLRQVVPVITQVALFLGPIFYPLEAVPAWLRPMFYLNPITLIVEDVRMAVFAGLAPNVIELAIYTFAAVLILLLGEWVFRRARPAFADVL